MQILQGIIGAGLAVMNLVYWWYAIQRAMPRFQRWCERRYDVEITTGTGGSWNVSGRGSGLRHFAISWLQFGFLFAAIVMWLIGVLLGAGGIYLLR